MKSLKKLIVKYSALLILVSVGTVFVNGAMPLLEKNVIDNLIGKKFDLISSELLKYGFLVILVLSFEFMSKIFTAMYSKGLFTKIRSLFVRGVLNREDNKGFQDPQELYSMYNNEISVLVEDYFTLIPSLIFQALSVIFYTFILFSLDTTIAIVVVSASVLTALLPYLFEGKLESARSSGVFSMRSLNTSFHDIAAGINTIRQYNVEKHAHKKIEVSSDEQQVYYYRYNLLSGVLECGIGLIQFSLSFLILYLMARSIIGGNSSVGAFVAVIRIADLMVYPITNFSQTLLSILSVKEIKKQIFEICSDDEFDDINKEQIHEISFENVTFAYPGSKVRVLENFTYKFEEGKNYLIMGGNGSGKSTLVKLLFSLVNSYGGNIKINGRDIENDKNLGKNITYVQQNSFIFNDSIISNICLYKDVSEGEVLEVLRRVNLDSELIDKRKEVLNDLSLSISGGEKQKIVLARALLMKNNFIVLDEAMSNVDSASSDAIEKSLLEDENISLIYIKHGVRDEDLIKYDGVLEFKNDGIVLT